MARTAGYFRIFSTAIQTCKKKKREREKKPVFWLGSLQAAVFQTWRFFFFSFEKYKGWHLKNHTQTPLFSLASGPNSLTSRQTPNLCSAASSYAVSCQVLLHKTQLLHLCKFHHNSSVNHPIAGWEFITTVAPGTWLNKPTGCRAGGGSCEVIKVAFPPSRCFFSSEASEQ